MHIIICISKCYKLFNLRLWLSLIILILVSLVYYIEFGYKIQLINFIEFQFPNLP